jgi:hypothetical protein
LNEQSPPSAGFANSTQKFNSIVVWTPELVACLSRVAVSFKLKKEAKLFSTSSVRFDCDLQIGNTVVEVTAATKIRRAVMPRSADCRQDGRRSEVWMSARVASPSSNYFISRV